MSLRVEYTNDDLCDKENLTPRIITHCVDNSGRWSQKGIMGKITTTYGKSVKELYEKNHKSNENNEIGDIQTLKISKEDEPDLYICTIVGQIYPFEKKGSTPQVSYSGFESALKEVRNFNLFRFPHLQNRLIYLYILKNFIHQFLILFGKTLKSYL